MNTNTVAAVVVTFNRKELLCECIDALLRQTAALGAIFVVDNASSDGTGDLLEERGYLQNPSIRYMRLAKNMGGAGGFNAGMGAAHQAGFDWVWVMDDDTEPHADALMKSRDYMYLPDVVAIANEKLDREGHPTGDGIRLFARSKANTEAHTFVRFSSFVGLLVSRDAIDRIGLPRTEFFIHDDDTEYCWRLRSIGKIVLATGSFVAHKEMARGVKARRVLSHTFYEQDIERFCLNYFGHRNWAWIQQHHQKNLFLRYTSLLARFSVFALAVLLFDRDHRWLRIQILAKAYLDGVRERFDNSYPWQLQARLRTQRSVEGVNAMAHTYSKHSEDV